MTDYEIRNACNKHKRANKGEPYCEMYGLMYYLVDSDELIVRVYDDYGHNSYTAFNEPVVCVDRELRDRGLPMTVENIKMIIDEQQDEDYSYWRR